MSPSSGGSDSKQSAKFRTYVRSLPLPVAMVDTDMCYVAWSDAWPRAHGLAAESLRGRSYYDTFPDTSAELRDVHRRCLAGESEHRDLAQRTNARGGVDYVRRRITPWRDLAGDVIGLCLYTEVITEEVETRRQLRERESFSQLLFERSTLGMNLCRLDGTWVESNPAFVEIIGYPQEEADGGLTYWELTPREYDPQEAVQLEALQATGRYGPYEKEFIRKDGSRIPVRLNGFVFDRDGESYIWSLIEDISERKRLEEQVHAERIKAIKASKLAVLGELAAGVAHEINNPLAIIEGYVEVLRRFRPSEDAALFDESLERLSEANARAAQIVNSLRKIARQDTGAALQRLSLKAVIEDTLDLYHARFRNRGVDLRVACDVDAFVRVRPNELSQVLINLLNNAFQAVNRLSERWIELKTERLGEGAVGVRVSDSGPGVPVELRDKIFDPFFTTKEVGKGTGLGLSISQSIVAEFDGALSVDPRHSHSSFLLELPVAEEDANG